jgi:hypothetical protein
MSRYKGKPSTKAIERAYPFIVELPVPENGFGNQLNVIGLFHDQFAIREHQGQGQYREPHQYARWCFADPQHAASFQTLFGGELRRGE